MYVCMYVWVCLFETKGSILVLVVVVVIVVVIVIVDAADVFWLQLLEMWVDSLLLCPLFTVNSPLTTKFLLTCDRMTSLQRQKRYNCCPFFWTCSQGMHPCEFTIFYSKAQHIHALSLLVFFFDTPFVSGMNHHWLEEQHSRW